ncbi:MAG TPA: type II toxin-antitoxin system HicB family antitoxin [Synergistaceae bacterium]|nr:type II toxin-antitoxin system HicB family antitoxin [Synergistaceae bacterium]HPQ38635.1 type II toxin-antitoxin system HicB family antitoxin [Synergistaceae bacterium]
MQDTYIFPAIFTHDEDGYAVEFPDLPGCVTCANTEAQAIRCAREALALYLWDSEKEGESIPEPSSHQSVTKNLQENEYVVSVDIFMPPFRHARENRATKVTTTIPFWLKSQADHAKLNYSALLQHAIKEQLGMEETRR